MKKISVLVLLAVILSSCEERVKIVDVESIKVDTCYYYKVERIDEGKIYYDIEKSYVKYKHGDYIKIIR